MQYSHYNFLLLYIILLVLKQKLLRLQLANASIVCGAVLVRGVLIWVFLHVPMSDIDSTKNTDNRYSLPIFLLVIK